MVIRICFWGVPPGDAREAGTSPGPGRNGGTMPQVREPCQSESAAGHGGGGPDAPGAARRAGRGAPLQTPPLGWDQFCREDRRSVVSMANRVANRVLRLG